MGLVTLLQVLEAPSVATDSRVKSLWYEGHEMMTFGALSVMLKRGASNSNAPMSVPSAPAALAIEEKSKGRGAPRWSVAKPKLFPLSIPGLPACNAIVGVGPPLF